MQEWWQAQLAAGLPALAGSQVSGTIVLKETLINEFLAQWLAGSSQPSAGMQTVDPTSFRKAVNSAAVRVETGQVLVDFALELQARTLELVQSSKFKVKIVDCVDVLISSRASRKIPGT